MAHDALPSFPSPTLPPQAPGAPASGPSASPGAERPAVASPSPQGISSSEFIRGRQLSPLKELATRRDLVAQAWRSLPRRRSVRDRGAGNPGTARGQAGVDPAQPLIPVTGVPGGSLLCPLQAALLAGRVQNLLPQGGRWGREKSFPMLVSPDSQVLRGLRRFSPSRSPQKAHTSCRVHITGGETEAQAEWPRRSGLRVSARRLLGLPVLLRAALQCSCAVIWAGARPSQTAPRWATVCSVCPHACEPSAHAHPRRTCCGACTGPPQPGSRARGLFLDGEGWDPLHVGAGQRVADVAAVRGPAVWPPATR